MAVIPTLPAQTQPATPQFHKPTFDETRMYVLVWGLSGCGKTTLAATAPGTKAYLQFDNQGVTSIANRDDYHLLDLSGATYTAAAMEFNKIDPFGIRAFVKANPDVQTIIIDSITTLAFQALQYAVKQPGGQSERSSIDVPGRHGYSVRNNVMRRWIQVIMQICGELKMHLIVITHEGAVDKDATGNTTGITMSLSDALACDVSLRFNEVWHMKDTGTERLIYVRPHSHWKPMKSRMFDTRVSNAFQWHYDADALTGEGIAEWFTKWQNNGGKKIGLPK